MEKCNNCGEPGCLCWKALVSSTPTTLEERFDEKFVGNVELDLLRPTRPQELKDFIHQEILLDRATRDKELRERISQLCLQNKQDAPASALELADELGYAAACRAVLALLAESSK